MHFKYLLVGYLGTYFDRYLTYLLLSVFIRTLLLNAVIHCCRALR